MGFRELLRLEAEDMHVVGEASTVMGAIAMCPPLHPDVAVLDDWLQDGSGIEACREICRQVPDTKCLMFASNEPNDDLLYRAILAGARGWVMKHANTSEVIDAIRVCAKGGSALDSHAQILMMQRLRHPDRQQSPLSMLTDQEQKIIRLIGGGLSNREIGRELKLTEKTVKNYVSRIFHKLGVQSRTQAIAYAHAAAFAHRATERIKDALRDLLTRLDSNQ